MTDIVTILNQRFGDSLLLLQETKDEFPTLWIKSDHIVEILRFLKMDAEEPYKMLYDLTAIDEQARAHRPEQPDSRFTVVYQLLSFERNAFLRLKVPLTADKPALPSITGLWPSANWYEREVYDLFGIRFPGHPHLKRILMPDSWEGHPLQKCHPARATEMPPYQLPEGKQEKEQFFHAIQTGGMGVG